MVASVLVKAVQYHLVNRGLDSSRGESTLNSAIQSAEGFANSLELWMVILGAVVLVVLLGFWTVVGKGSGSHAGREEPRRAYRRELARQMARQDAEKIKIGEKPRRRWMQW